MKTFPTRGLALGLGLGIGWGAAGDAAAQVKFAVGGPITGPNASFGAQLKNGTEQAVADINASGGILGQKIALESGDDVSDPKQGVSIANKFAGNGVKFVIGHFNSGVTMPASYVYAENGMLAITPAATNPCGTAPKLGPCLDNKQPRPSLMMFRTCGRDDQQGEVAGAYNLKTIQANKIAAVQHKPTSA